jgi:hypothetical protein
MKQTLVVLFSLLTFSSFAQDYKFDKDFVDGSIILKDSTLKAGQIKWDVNQTQRLRFRENGKTSIVKYSPEDIAGFIVGSQKFVSLIDFSVCADTYSLIGRLDKVKRTFGEVIDTGKFNIYLVYIIGVNAISNSILYYPNFLFQKTGSNATGLLVPYPFNIRMKEKKYENAKADLYALFKDYPNIVEAIKIHTKYEDFYDIVEMVKEVNRR